MKYGQLIEYNMRSIYECPCGFSLVKNMRFSEPLQASCFRVALISGDENINQLIFFISHIPFHQAFLELSEVVGHGFSETFGELLGKNSGLESMPTDSAILSSAKVV